MDPEVYSSTNKNTALSSGIFFVAPKIKNKDGLDITDLLIKNKCLLSKWLFKLLNEEGAWRTLHIEISI